MSVDEGDYSFMASDRNDEVSTIWVQPNCEVQMFMDADYGGDTTFFNGPKTQNDEPSVFNLDSKWNDALSSYKCHCKGKLT